MMDGGAALPVPDGEDASEYDREPTSRESVSDVGGSFNRDMMNIMRVLAETQRDLARSRGGDKANKVRVLSNIKIPEFEGGVSTSVRRYSEWRTKFDIIQDLSDLTNSEMAVLLYSQVTGRPKMLIEVISPEDLRDGTALNMIYRIYDEAYERMSHGRLDDVLHEWESAFRRHGQPMQDWCTYLRKLRMELHTQDGGTKVSDQALASKMLRSSRLTTTQRAQVLFKFRRDLQPGQD